MWGQELNWRQAPHPLYSLSDPQPGSYKGKGVCVKKRQMEEAGAVAGATMKVLRHGLSCQAGAFVALRAWCSCFAFSLCFCSLWISCTCS